MARMRPLEGSRATSAPWITRIRMESASVSPGDIRRAAPVLPAATRGCSSSSLAISSSSAILCSRLSSVV